MQVGELDLTSRTRRHLTSGTSSSHNVQFYDGDAYLIDSVSEFVARGLVAGQRCIVIATHRHRLALSKQLAKREINVTRARPRAIS